MWRKLCHQEKHVWLLSCNDATSERSSLVIWEGVRRGTCLDGRPFGLVSPPVSIHPRRVQIARDGHGSRSFILPSSNQHYETRYCSHSFTRTPTKTGASDDREQHEHTQTKQTPQSPTMLLDEDPATVCNPPSSLLLAATPGMADVY